MRMVMNKQDCYLRHIEDLNESIERSEDTIQQKKKEIEHSQNKIQEEERIALMESVRTDILNKLL